MAVFDLGELIRQGKVPNLGTTQSREQIEYIDLDLIDDDPRNFYELSGIEELAANIELLGLQQPIRVRPDPEDHSRVIIVSGHRRRAAIRKLAEEEPEKWRQVPCIREEGDVSPALQELRLIYANNDTRKMSAADLAKQAERVEALLYQLKEEGYDFPGRMRDHVAQACQVSKSKLSRLKVIREKLSSDWVPHYEKGKINESVAYALAQQPEEYQQKIYQMQMEKNSSLNYFYSNDVERQAKYLEMISKITCERCGGAACQNQTGKWRKVTGQSYYYGNCTGTCCDQCADLASCYHACPLLAEKVKKLKADKREAKRQEKLAQEAEELPKIKLLENLWIRFGAARAAAGKSVKEFEEALGIYYSSRDDKEFKEREDARKITVETTLPYGYGYKYTDAHRIIAAADFLGCSLDYLFCRTDVPNPEAQKDNGSAELLPIGDPLTVAPPAPDLRMIAGMDLNDPNAGPSGQMVFAGWMPGGTTPSEPCDVVAAFDLGGGYKHKKLLARWNGREFLFSKGGAKIEMPVVKWMALPPDSEDD